MKGILILLTGFFLLMAAPMGACGAGNTYVNGDTLTEIRGSVVDSLTQSPIAGASITLLRNGKPLKFTRTKTNGTFVIGVSKRQTDDVLQATCMGYKKQKTPVDADKATVISMASSAFVLKEVQVKGSRVTGRDTITFDLTRFADERDNSLKDVLKKLPGVDVAKNGQINYNGKPINRFTVEGLDLTGGRYNQLEENIKAKDVKKAEIVEHDQPIKALQNKTFTDNVAMNIALKDSARDRLLPTITPYLLVGSPTHVGGSANIMQIGRKKQMMYEAAYDRTGKNLAGALELLASYSGRLASASLPSWLSAPSLQAPIDAERLRFNTSQKYSVNHISKNNSDAERRFEANYVRQVIRQQTENTSVYNLGGNSPVTTTERTAKTMISDALNLVYENKVNREEHYGNDYIGVSAAQNDGLSNVGDTLSQRIRIPEVNMEASIYRLFVYNKSRLSWRSVADYHHGASDLYVNADRNRISTNLWHTAHALSWQQNKMYWTQQYSFSIDARNINVGNRNSADITGKLTPYWQYQTENLRISFSPDISLVRFSHPQKTIFAVSPFLYLYRKLNFRKELTAYLGYSTSTGPASNYALDSYRRSYRSWYTSGNIIPVTKSLYGKVSYNYKRPIKELFFSAAVTGSRYWMNTATDLRIVDGNYYTSLYSQNSKTDNVGASAYISKGFYDFHLKTRLTAEYNYGNGEQYTSHRAVGYENNTYTLIPAIDFSPSWCQLSYEGQFVKYDTRSDNTARSSLFNWKQSLSATATVDNVDLTLSAVHYRNELQDGNRINCLLGDASAVWRIKKVRFSAELRNIFNKKSYVETSYSGVSTMTDSYRLRPREFMLKAQISL